jgi:hypothetical protein
VQAVTMRRSSQILAAAVALAVGQSAHAVIFNSTGSPTFNTTAPTGPLANSGWQYQGNLGNVLATAIAPNYILSAAHVAAGVGTTFSYNGITYTTTSLQDFGDLRLYGVDQEIVSYAPLYDATSDGDETSKNVVVIGRGTQRGAEVQVSGEPKGWLWGAEDNVRRWGENIVTGIVDDQTVGDQRALVFDFDRSGAGYSGVNEAHLSTGDSGGGVFIKVDGQWKLAGINYAVTGPYSYTPTGPTFLAALYDTGGLYDRSGNIPVLIPETPADQPSSWYASRVAASVNAINSIIDLPPTWNVNAGGNWSTSANWANGGAPNGAGSRADFRTVISAPRTVTLDSSRTVGSLYFDSLQPYTIAGPGTLTLDAAPESTAGIRVGSGSHTISAAVTMVDATDVNVMSPNSTLTISAPLIVSASLNKTGPGTLAVKHVRGGTLTVTAGAVAVTANGTNDATSQVSSLAVSTGATLDLADNDLVTNTPVGTFTGSTYDGLIGRIASARGEDGAWAGAGITSSAAIENFTGLGIARAGEVLSLNGSQTTLWSGRTVGAETTLIAYTYQGDLNLDGQINADDYALIDLYSTFANASGYSHGDINYNGAINADDYALIDFNSTQSLPDLIDNGGARSFGMTAVPEPAGVTVLALLASATVTRRRRVLVPSPLEGEG